MMLHDALPICPFNLFGAALDGYRVGYAPMCGHGLSRPDWANLFGRFIADRKDEIQLRRIRSREFFPGLTPKIRRVKPRNFYLFDSLGPHHTRWMASRAIRRKVFAT